MSHGTEQDDSHKAKLDDKQERKLHTAHEIEAVERELMRRSAEVPTVEDSYGV